MAKRRALLIVLDGFGDGKDYPFNAIRKSKMPFYSELSKKFPRAQLITCGEQVGLPPGVMGNSEVGHMNMGAGRIVYQELTRINKSIREGEFARNPEVLNAIAAAKKSGGRLHLMGLLSDAGVHSDTSHLYALLDLAAPSVPVTVHAFTDGRDTPPLSARKYAKDLMERLGKYEGCNIGSVCGRYYAMDRDNRWDRVEKAWKAITGQMPASKKTLAAALEDSFAQNVTDEFVVPVHFEAPNSRTTIEDGDAIIFFNFRADRARELSRAFTDSKFDGFKAPRPKLARYLCMTEYDKTLSLPVAYKPQNLEQIFPEILAERGLRQYRIAETEKYAHVTFFFNGGREAVFAGEERELVPSPRDVATYDLKPEMSAPQVADLLAARLLKAQDEFAVVNFANPDMVGHTGNFAAAVKALECVDRCLNKVISAALASGFDTLLTADHGNIEEMCDDHDQPHTQHTLNPVPVHLITKRTEKLILRDGILADVAPTMLQLMDIEQPSLMTGKTLLK